MFPLPLTKNQTNENTFSFQNLRIICGLTAFTTRNHIIRAALEAICFQTRDILEAIELDLGMTLRKLNVDGPMTENNLLMQLQADLSGLTVCKFN